MRVPQDPARVERPLRGLDGFVGWYSQGSAPLGAPPWALFGSPALRAGVSAGQVVASKLSAISSNFLTLFQFLPVPDTFIALSTAGQLSLERPCPSG